jgi:predicted nucleic acid-binding protein
MFVADASTALEWVIPGQLSAAGERAFKLAKRSPIVVPTLWIFETHNAILKLTRRQILTPEKEREIRLEIALLSKRVEDPPDQNGIDRIWEIATTHMMTFYDASYVELAWRLKLPIASSDSAISSAARKLELCLV